MDSVLWVIYLSPGYTETSNLIPELMAYMATVVRVSQDCASLVWVKYNTIFWRQAALIHNMKWSVINLTQYTMYFAGIASLTKSCKLCFATTYTK